MAAFYSPNGRVPIDTEALAHSRSHSTLSNAPLLTNRTSDSHPTDPLLRSPLAPTAASYHGRASRKEDTTPADLSLNPLRRTATPIAQKSPFRNALGAFKRQTKPITLSLELIIAIWASYNAIRYFLAFLRYRNALGQAFSLSLAITAGISAVLALWAMTLSVYILRWLSSRDGEIWHSLLLSLRSLSAFFLLVPAAVNIVVVFVWKTSPNSDLDLHARCQIDVDVVWSTAPNKCPIDPPSWSLWVALSFIRFLLTASLLGIYLTASFFTFLSSTKRSHRHSRSDLGGNEPSLARITTLTDHHPSELTLVTLNSDSSPQRGCPRLARSRSFDTSPDFGKTATQAEADREMSGFVERFRSLISQITLEMESTLEAPRSDSPTIAEINRDYTFVPKPYPSEYNDIMDANDDNYNFSRYDKDNMFNLPPPPMALGYNEFGVPYPPEQNVRVMGGFVRRMPTIESMGSGELTSRSSGTSHRHDASENRASSRPPTRTTFLTVSTSGHDSAGSNPPSRANSLSSRAEVLMRLSPISPTSEHGELLGRIDHRLSSPSSGDYTFKSLSSATDDATSYHTAAMGSYSPTSVYHDGMPVERDI